MGKKAKRHSRRKRYDVSFRARSKKALTEGTKAKAKTGIWPSPKFQCDGGR